MTLHQALLVAALRWLTLPNGQTYVKWCLPEARCEAMVEQAVEDVELVSLIHGLDPWDTLALVMRESNLNPRSRSSIGAFGLLQLHPRGPTGRLVRKACRLLSQRECDRLAALEGARMFADNLQTCGTVRRAFYAHRLGECGRGPLSDADADRAIRMRRAYERARRREAWGTSVELTMQ